MDKVPRIGIYAPSYRRPAGVHTQNYLPGVTYVVAESEAEAYRKEGHRIRVCPDEVQGNLCRVRNWILENARERWVLLLDDDLRRLGQWNGNELKWFDADQAEEFIEAHFMLAHEMGVRFWGLNVLPDKGCYREYTPFCLSAYIGGPFQAFLEKKEFRYDESLPLKEDYDMTLQICSRDRKVLRVNYGVYQAIQHTNPGGCASYRTIQREKEQMEALRRKWGSRIVRKDSGNSRVRRKKEQADHDINPIIKIPIRGV